MIKSLSALLFTFALVHQVLGFDETLVPGARGESVVETVCSRIESVCIFPDSKLMLRRIAYVESNDGLNPRTYVTGYNGGIWKVDMPAFIETKKMNSSLYEQIQTTFNIDWRQVAWEDLQKPFYSGLAARLYLHSLTDSLPRSVDSQASLWAKKYRPGSQPSQFSQKAADLRRVCNGVADIAFIVDSSGSIKPHNFLKVKAFMKNITKSLNLGPDPDLHSRLAVLLFSYKVELAFNMNAYTRHEDYAKALDKLPFLGGETQTHEALKLAANRLFVPSAGARGKEVPKIAIVLTDGASDNFQQTIAYAKAIHNKKITVFAVGIGDSLNHVELRAIASSPECKHLSYLDNFDEFESLVEAVERRTCEASIEIPKHEPITMNVPRNGSVNCQIYVDDKKNVLEITGLGQSTIYFSNFAFPTPSYFDSKYEITYFTPAVVTFSEFNHSNNVVYCHVVSKPCKDSTLNIVPNNNYTDPCHPDPCPCGFTCVRKLKGEFTCERDMPQEQPAPLPIITHEYSHQGSPLAVSSSSSSSFQNKYTTVAATPSSAPVIFSTTSSNFLPQRDNC